LHYCNTENSRKPLFVGSGPCTLAEVISCLRFSRDFSSPCQGWRGREGGTESGSPTSAS